MRSVILIILLTFFFNAGCGPKKIETAPEREFIFFPSLPDSPKYQYLTSFSSLKDIQKKKSKFFKFIVGEDKKIPQVIKKAYGLDIYDGVIYVCDIGNKVVITLNLKTRKFGYIGTSGKGKLVKPINLKIDRENNILYVADIGRKQVLCFTLDGKLVRAYGKDNQFNPVAVDYYANKLFICDVSRHQIFVIDKKNGEQLYTIGKPGSKDGELFHPTNIYIRDERLYVSDTSNFRIQIFDMEGKFLSTFGKIGDRPGNFSRNKGIAVDKEKRIYVVDAAFENVQVFNHKFKLLLFMFSPGMEKHNINLPAGISIDYDNIKYFKKYLSPKFDPEYLLLVASNFGLNKINVYAFGNYRQ